MTNRDFANAVGCSTTMASRMRNGKRAPSVAMLNACIREFELNEGEAIRAAVAPAIWGAFLRHTVFSRVRTGARAGACGPTTVPPAGGPGGSSE